MIMKRINTLTAVTLMTLALLCSGCGGKAENSSNTSVSLSFPSAIYASLSANAVTTYIAINVTGGSNAPIYWIWDGCASGACDNNDDPTLVIPAPPDLISLTIPTGDTLLFQVFVIKEDLETKTEYLYYGESRTLVDPTSSTQSVDIVAAEFGIMTESGETNISGQYLTSPGAGPTGQVGLFITPPAPHDQSPQMFLHKESIINGWFEFFTYSGLKFTYKLLDAEGRPIQTLFNDLEPTSPELTPSSKVLLVRAPTTYRVSKFDYNTPNWDTVKVDHTREGPRDYIYGFFGPAASTEVVCYSQDEGVDVEYYYNPGVSVFGVFTDSTGDTPLQWYGIGGNSSHLQRIGGGVDENEISCTGATEFLNKLNFVVKDYNGSRGAGFDSAFSKPTPFFTTSNTNTYSPFVNHLYNMVSQDLTLKWQFLPSIVSSGGVDGVMIAYKHMPGSTRNERQKYERNGGCEKAVSEGGYSSVVVTAGTTQHTLNAISPSQLPYLSALVCPFDTINGSNMYYANAVVSPYFSAGSAGTVGPIVRFAGGNIATDGLTVGSCTPFVAQLDGTSPLDTSTTVQLSCTPLGGGTCAFYSTETDCTNSLSPITSTVINWSTNSSATVYVKSNDLAGVTMSLDISGNANGGMIPGESLSNVPVKYSASLNFSSIYYKTCSGAQVDLNAAAPGGGLNVELTCATNPASTGECQIYPTGDPTCSGASTNVVPVAGSATFGSFYYTTGSNTDVTFSVTPTASIKPDISFGNRNFQVTNPGQFMYNFADIDFAFIEAFDNNGMIVNSGQMTIAMNDIYLVKFGNGNFAKVSIDTLNNGGLPYAIGMGYQPFSSIGVAGVAGSFTHDFASADVLETVDFGGYGNLDFKFETTPCPSCHIMFTSGGSTVHFLP